MNKEIVGKIKITLTKEGMGFNLNVKGECFDDEFGETFDVVSECIRAALINLHSNQLVGLSDKNIH